MVSFATGLSQKNTHAYGVMIGSNIDALEARGKHIMMVSRMNRMYPQNSINLDNFRKHLSQFKQYYLIPADIRDLEGLDMNETLKEFGIRKIDIEIKEAWRITDNEMLMSVLDDDEDPLVPSDVKDPPVLKALAKIRALRKDRKK